VVPAAEPDGAAVVRPPARGNHRAAPKNRLSHPRRPLV